jgi:hypothetical protein
MVNWYIQVCIGPRNWHGICFRAPRYKFLPVYVLSDNRSQSLSGGSLIDAGSLMQIHLRASQTTLEGIQKLFMNWRSKDGEVFEAVGRATCAGMASGLHNLQTAEEGIEKHQGGCRGAASQGAGIPVISDGSQQVGQEAHQLCSCAGFL